MIDHNPFQPAPGASPPELVGRAGELASIEDAAQRIKSGSPPTPIVFTGLRGMGKTVLLSRLVSSAGPKALALRLEVESDVALSNIVGEAVTHLLPALASAPKRIASKLDAALRALPRLQYDLPNEMGALSMSAPDEEEPHVLPIRTAISALNDAVRVVNRFLVITIDEIHDVDIASLRTVASAVHRSAATKSPILFACAGLPQTSEVIQRLRTYAHRWDQYELGLLLRAEVAQAIRLPIERAGATISPEALDLLIEHSAGYPFFVQKYASAAWSAHHHRRIGVNDVESILLGVRDGIEKQFYRRPLESLSPRERMLVIALADLGAGAHELRNLSAALGTNSAALGSIRTQLIKKGIVFSPYAGSLQFRIPLAERYVIEHRDEYETGDVIKYRAKFGA